MPTCLPVHDPTIPFWYENPDEFHNHRTTEALPAFSDVVIIGAGYAGISTAYHLVKDEEASNKPSVTILEARGVCTGATGRNGGHLRPDMYGHIPKYMARGGVEAGKGVSS